MHDALQQAEKMLHDCVLQITGVPVPPVGFGAIRRIGQPIRTGGLGIRSPLFVATAAFMSSAINAMPLLQDVKHRATATGSTLSIQTAVTRSHLDLLRRGAKTAQYFRALVGSIS